MRLTLGLVLAAATTAVGSFGGFRERMQRYEADSRAAKQALVDSATDATVSSKPAHKFLTAKTKKFAVDGTSLPLIPFDVGESYSGLLPIDKTGRELFFWFFPTQGEGSKDITIWLNGGPGCSSLIGLLEENGPFLFQPGTYGPVKNPYAINKLSNVVWVEQPVGTGFTQGKPNATNEIEVGEQFDGFWKNFVDTFDLQNYGIYITGESYAGQYVPYIGQAFLKAGGQKYHNLKGISIYDPVVGGEIPQEAATVPFVHYNSASMPFNATFVDEINKLQESCGYAKYMAEGLTFPPKHHLPKIKLTKEFIRKCDVYDMVYNEIYKLNPCFNIYHVSETCPTAGDILGGIGVALPAIPVLKEPYFNRDDVKKAIHAPLSAKWSECKGDVLRKDTSPGSGEAHGPLAYIAGKINNVIVGHAKNDFILLSNGTLLTLNNLVWNGKQGFDKPPTTPLVIPVTRSTKKSLHYTQIGSWTKSRGLTFVEVELSGHMIPQFNPRANYRIQEVLQGHVKSLDALVPFTG